MATFDLAIAAFETDPRDAYWARRVCEEAGRFRNPKSEKLYARALACVVSKDPYNVVEESRLGIAHRLGLYGCTERTLRAVESHIRIGEKSLAQHIKGKLWVAAMSAMHDTARLESYARRACSHLRKVRREQRTARFLEAYCHACAWADYEGLIEHFDAFFRVIVSYERRDALVLVLDAAARHHDWKTYDRYRDVYAKLPRDDARAHDDCKVLNLDGLRALAKRDVEGARRILADLIERAQNVAFIGGPNTLSFVQALVRRRLFAPESRDYLLLACDGGARFPRGFTKAMRQLVTERHSD